MACLAHDAHASIGSDAAVTAIHRNAERFDPRAEEAPARPSFPREHSCASRSEHPSRTHAVPRQQHHSPSRGKHPSRAQVFKYIQVFTAVCDSFAHGANDVANAVGPYMALYATYKLGRGAAAADRTPLVPAPRSCPWAPG